jgi:hypothetical protein
MTPTQIVVVVVIAIVAIAVAILFILQNRSKTLRAQFGPQYDRTVKWLTWILHPRNLVSRRLQRLDTISRNHNSYLFDRLARSQVCLAQGNPHLKFGK